MTTRDGAEPLHEMYKPPASTGPGHEDDLRMTESTLKKRRLSRLPRGRQESRVTVLEHEEAAGRLAARLIRVEGAASTGPRASP